MAGTELDFSAFIADRTRDFIGHKWVLAEIDAWMADHSASRFSILTGESDIGKSAVTARVAC